MEKIKEEEIKKLIEPLKGWYYESGSIKKKFKTKGFAETMGLVSAIGALCQQLDHHPDYLYIKYAEIEASFSTHTAGGITEKDIEAAKQINGLFV